MQEWEIEYFTLTYSEIWVKWINKTGVFLYVSSGVIISQYMT